MAKPAYLNSNLLFLLSCVAVITILLLTSFNFSNYLAPKKVLGTETNTEEILKEKGFWEEFLAKNPDYLPGWLEIGRLDKVYEINPNFWELLP